MLGLPWQSSKSIKTLPSIVGDVGMIPSWGAEIPQAS